MLHALTLHFDQATFEFAPGCVAHGKGRLDLTSHLGPLLSFEGLYDGDDFDVMRAVASEPQVEPGEMLGLPERPFSARSGDVIIEAQHLERLGPASYNMGQPVPVIGDWAAFRLKLTSAAVRPPGAGVVVDVHFRGRGTDNLLFPVVAGLPVPDHRGAIVKWGVHEFILREDDTMFAAQVRGIPTGTFTYRGPADPGSEEFWDVVWPFVLVLGSALGGPLDPIGWVTRSPNGSFWYGATWRRHGKAHTAACLFRPVGGQVLAGALRNVVAWVEAGLATWSRSEPNLGLEVALLYLENAHGQAEPEIRCRDLVNALERLIVGCLRVHRTRRLRALKDNIALVSGLVGRSVFTEAEIDDIVKFRNRLAHDGGLLDVRVPDRVVNQALADAEEWLATCVYRLLAAIFEVDVPLADAVTRGPVQRRPSEGGFTRSPFVPAPT